MPSQFQDYFNDRINQEIEKNALVGVATKYDEVQKAATDKIAELEIAHKEALKIRELQANSWVGKLGLDPDGLAGEAVNKTASFISGAGTLAGNLLSLPSSLAAAADESSLTQPEIDAYNRKVQGTATADDMALLTRKKAFYSERDTPEAKARAQELADRNPNGLTALDLIERSKKAREISNKITDTTNVSSIVHSQQRDRLTNQMGWDFQKAWDQTGLANLFEKDKQIGGVKDVAEGLAKLVYNAGEAAVSNPSAASEYVIENLPQLLSGGMLKHGTKLLTAANAGYAMDNYNKGMAKYAAENNGAMPPPEERQSMALWAASTALAEQLGELGQLKAIGKVRTAADLAKDGTQTGFLKAVGNTAKAGATGYGEEAVTEGYQTYAEAQAKREPVTAKEVYIGAGVGGLAGGGTSLGGRAAAELLGATPEKQQERINTAKRSEVYTEAAKTGNVDALLDPKSMHYNPSSAIDALLAHTQQAGTTEETKQANLDKINAIVDGLEQKRADVAAKHFTVSEAGLKQLQDEREQAIAEGRDDLVQVYDEQIADISKDTKAEPRLRKQLQAIDQQLADSKAARTAYHQEMQAKTVDLEQAIAKVKSSVPLEAHAAAEQIINLSMAAPERLHSDVAAGLAADPTNGLTDQQRAYFRAFTDARIAENAAKDSDAVNDEILYGGNGNVGLQQYREDVQAALAANDHVSAIKAITQLSKFAADHKAKAEAAAKALKQSMQTNKAVTIRSDGKQGWFVQEGPALSEAQRQAEGAFTVHKGSAKQVAGFALESKAIDAALGELTAAVDIRVVPPSEADNVKDVSPAEGTQKAEEQSTGEAKTEERQSEGTGSDGQRAAEPAVQSNDGAAADTESAAPAVAKGTKTTEEAPASSVKSVKTKEEGQLQSTEQTVKAAETTTAEDAGQGLTVLKTKTSEQELPEGTKMGAVFRTLNRAVAFLKQTKQRIDSDADIAKDRPLVSIGNFLSMWNKGDVLPSDMFAENLTEEEIGALATFQKFATKWSPIVRANLIKGGLPNMKGTKPRADFLFEDPIQDFFNEDGSIDENVVTAIVYGAYAWLSVSANGPKLKDNESILKMLGIQEGTGVTVASGRNPLRTMTTFQDAAANTMGRYVVDALGLKPNGKQTVDYMGRLTTAFGLQAMVLLAGDGVDVIDTVSISGNEMNEYLPGLDVQATGQTKEGKPVYPEYGFVRIKVDGNFKLQGASKEIQEATVQSHGVLQRLFSAERPAEFASWVPIKFGQQVAKKTKQAIPSLQRKILNEAVAAPQRVIPAMWDALSVLGDELFLKAAGWTEYHEDKVQAENRENILAKNRGLEDQLANMKALVSDAIKNSPDKIAQPFYTMQEVWRNFRVGVASANLNLQSSKIQRFSFFRPEWESKIDLNDQAAKSRFLISVAQAFGVKIDQQPNEQTLDKFEAMVTAEDGRINKLATALAKALETPDQQVLTEAQKQEVAEFSADAEGMQSLQALVAYGQYLVAKNAGLPEVTVHMLVGVDGKTNGPILTQLALGAATSVGELFERLNRGGMYKADDGVETYNHWYARATSLDLYEDLSFHILNGIEANATLNAITTFTKKLVGEDGKVTSAGRNLAKTPLTAFVFGSSIDGSVRSMQEAFVQSVFDRIQDVATGVDKKTSVADIVASLNALMGTKLPANTTIEQLMQRQFSMQEKAEMMSKFYEQIGSRVEETMKAYFSTFLERRNNVNRAVQGAFEIYNRIYQDLRAQEMNRLMDEGEIDFVMRDGQRVPIHNMTAAQEAALRERVKKIMPLANTAYTVGTDELDAGLYMAKTNQTMSNEMYDSVKIQLGQRIPAKNGYPVSTYSGRATVQTESSPGVAGLPYFMHSLDSFIMHTSLQGSQTLNVHDEAANGVNNVEKTANSINKATWEGMLKFSPPTEAYELLARTIKNAAELMTSGQLSDETIGWIANILRAQLPFKVRDKVKDENLASVVLALAAAQKWEANKVRLEAMAEMTSIDQYTWEGGQYTVTDADRQQAKDMLERELQQGKPDAETQAAADAIDKLFASTNLYKGKKPVKIEADRTSVFGQLGTPAIKSDGDLVNFFSRNPKATAKDVIALLAQPGRLNSINRKLLQLVSRIVPADLPISYVTSKTAEDQVLAKAEMPSRGWYVVKGNAESIYVLSPEFKDSGLTAETLLHELIHAAIAKTIAAPSKDAAALVAELEELRTKAMEYVTANKLAGFEAALSNVQEFVAWGMSNLQFQRDVLTKITMESKTKGNPLVSGMQKFIETLGKLLFKRPDAEVNNGLNVLMSNVSGLFYEAGQSKPKDMDLNLSMATVNSVLELGTQEIFQALDNGAVSPQFQSHLAEVLTGIEERLHGPFGSFLAQFRDAEAANPLAAWLKTIETGKAPFASAIVASGMAGSAQEDFVMQQVEATVKAMLDGTEATTTAVYNSLSKLYTEVSRKLTPQDFINVGLTAADYGFVFKLESDNGEKSDYLARFMALGLGHEKFAKLLAFETAQDTSAFGAGATLFDRMVNIFDKIVQFFNQKITHTFGGQPADAKLKALMDDLVTIEAKKRHSLARKAAGEVNVVTKIEKATKGAVDSVKAAVTDVVESKIIKENRLQTVRAVGTGVKVFTKGQVDQVLGRLRQMRDMRNKKRDDVLDGLMREVRGPLERFKMLLIEAKKNEGTRKDIIAQHTRLVAQSFKDGGKGLTREAKAAISAVFLRTGAHNLLDHFSMAQIENLLSDPAALDAAIAQFQGNLTTGLRDHHIQQANYLGLYKATGRNAADVLMFNAHVIARMFNTQYAGQITEQQAAAEEPTIAVLATLYAMKYQGEIDRKQAIEVLRAENLRNDGNGVLFTLELYKELEKDSLQNLFGGNRTLMMHGYTPEIVNPHTEVRVADRFEGASLMRQGYVKGAKVNQDPHDPDPSERHIYVLKDGGLAPWLSGFLSLTSMQAKGSEKHSGYLNANTVSGLENAQVNATILGQKVAEMKPPKNPGRDLSKQMGGSKLAPTYNSKGEIVNWRYLMLESTRNTVMERTNDFDQIMGAYAGSIFDKVSTQDQNEVAVKAMREQYELDRATNPTAYVEVGARSADPEMRELWRLLPQGTRDAVVDIWGRDGMRVRKDSLDIAFGYRKLSAADFLRKEQQALKGMPLIARELFNSIARMRGMDKQAANDWAKRLGLAIVKGERGWQEIVHEIKDMVVVKNLTTLLGNIYSNDSLLFMLGVENRWHHQWVAIKGVLAYQEDSERLAEIEATMSSGYPFANMTELQREAVRLRDSIARNPVKPLIDSGMMPTIVEDVEAEVDPYSYKTWLGRKMEGYTSRIPKGIKAVGRVAYMTHDTKLYKFLSKTTQYSDFVARYALYQHLTTKAENPMAHEDAISEVSDAFVNYDVPMHRLLQYTDDMGFTPFIKYFFRIQRFLMKTARENPARVMSLVLLGRFWDLGPIVLDSSFVAHIGNNPFTTGALRYFSTLDELLTAKAAMSLIK